MLAREGIRLVDAPDAGLFELLKDGDAVRVDGGAILVGGREVLRGRVLGLDDVIALAEPFTPEAVAGPSGVPAATIRTLAHDLAAASNPVLYSRIGACTQEFGTLDQQQPPSGFTKFFQADLELMRKILAGFGRLGLAVIRQWRRSAADKLPGNMVTSPCIRQLFHHAQDRHRIIEQPIFQIVLSCAIYLAPRLTDSL